MKRKCKWCSEEFSVRPSRVRNGGGTFCSNACKSSAQTKKVTVNCATCAVKTKKTPLQIKRSQSGMYFCSKSCQTMWRNKVYVGSKHLQWKGGRHVNYRKRVQESGRLEQCKRCHTQDKRVLVVHHVDEDRSNNKLDNLVYLCHNCHHLVHSSSKEQKKLFEEVQE